jgi:hypothetical protein
MEGSDYLKRPDVQPYLKVCECLRKWDPIGVFEIADDWPKDEYDGYAPAIVRLLDQGANAVFVADFLNQLVHNNMGLKPDPNRSKEIAQELVEYWKCLP